MKKFKFALALLLVGTLVSFAAKAQTEYIPFKSTVFINVSNGVSSSEATDLTDPTKVDAPVTIDPCTTTPLEIACAWQITVSGSGCTITSHTTTQKFSALSTVLASNPLPTNSSACGLSRNFTIDNCTYTATLRCKAS